MGLDLAKRNLFNRRVYFISIFKGILLLFITFRLGFLQIFFGKKYKTIAKLNSTKISFTPSARGDILDRNNKIAVTTKKSRMIIYTDIPLKKSSMITINRVLDIIYQSNENGKAIALKKIVRYAKNYPYVEIPLHVNLSDELFERIAFHLPNLNNIEIHEINSRDYKLKEVAAHIFGYAQKASQEMVNNATNVLLKKLYRSPNYYIGSSGIELAENEWLAGKCGIDGIFVDNLGNSVSKHTIQDAISGNDVQVTIDSDIQAVLAEHLSDKSGAGVVIDIESGEIIAMQSSPSFNPNDFLQWDNITGDLFLNQEKPLLNRCTCGLYPPGSTFKPITAMNAVLNGWNPERKIMCNGEFVYANRVYHCWKKGGHGMVDLHKAIAQSCNVYFYTIGVSSEIDKIYNVAKTMGFDTNYNIGIGKEYKGCIPNRTWKSEKMHEAWFPGDTINTVIGQGFNQVNILQLAVYAARIASGKDIQPSIWKGFINKNNLSGVYHKNEVVNRNFASLENISDDALNLVRRGMYSCINEEIGSLFNLTHQYRKYQICGKTGTAQTVSRVVDADVMRGNMKLASNGLFFGYAPFDKPKYAIGVVIEKGIWGSQSAGPVALKTLAFALDKILV